MTFKKIDNIRINGKSTAFGGFVYDANYQVNHGTEPSTLSITFISENGSYNISKNNLRTIGSPDVISLGDNKTLRMYPVEYRYEKRNSGKVLTVDYVDTSINFLDKINVVLGPIRGGGGPGIIAIGRRYQMTGVDLTESVSISVPVLEQPNTAYINLPVVYYTLLDLYNGMVAQSVPMHSSVLNLIQGVRDFRVQYEGTLRDVLAGIADDIGVSFFWNEDSLLQFIDLKTPVFVNKGKVEGLEKIEETEITSVRETFSTGAISFLGREGETGVSPSTHKSTFFMRRLDIPRSSSLFNIPDTDEINNFIKAAYLGKDIFLFYSVAYLLNIGSDGASEDPRLQFARAQPKEIDDIERKREWLKQGEIIEGSESPSDLADYAIFSVSGLNYLEAAYERYAAYANTLGRFYARRIIFRATQKYNWDVPFIWFNSNFNSKSSSLAPIASKSPNEYSVEGLLAAIDLIITTENPEASLGEVESAVKQFNRATSGSIEDENLNEGIGYAIYEYEPEWKAEGEIDPNAFSTLFTSTSVFQNAHLKDDTFFLVVKRSSSSQIRDYINSMQFPSSPPSIKATGERSVSNGYFVERLINTERTLVDPTLNVGSVRYNIKDIDEATVILEGNSLKQAHIKYNENLTYQQLEPIESISFKVQGIDIGTDLKISDGLESINISYEENGLFTTYQMGNSRVKIPSEDILRQRTENGMNVRLAGPTIIAGRIRNRSR